MRHVRILSFGRENLCVDFAATGRDVNGGYAEYMTVPAGFAYPLPTELSDAEAAPLLCAGAVGYRALRLTGIADGSALGLFGFGASNHLVLKTARHLYPACPGLRVQPKRGGARAGHEARCGLGGWNCG